MQSHLVSIFISLSCVLASVSILTARNLKVADAVESDQGAGAKQSGVGTKANVGSLAEKQDISVQVRAMMNGQHTVDQVCCHFEMTDGEVQAEITKSGAHVILR